MKVSRLLKNRCVSLFIVVAVAACNGPSHDRPPPGPSNEVHPPREVVHVAATHTASSPFTATTSGDLAFVSADLALASTDRGIVAIATTGTSAGHLAAGFGTWALTSTGSGSAASALAIVESAIPGGAHAFFLPNGRNQAGVLWVGTASMPGSVISESALASNLSSMFPSAIAAPITGPAASSLWIVDAVFGPGGAVRTYDYGTWSKMSKQILPAVSKVFQAPDEDVDADGTNDVAALDRLTFTYSGKVGVVSFSFVAPAPKNAAGGAYLFSGDDASKIGRVIVPTTSTVSGTLEFVSAVAVSDNLLLLASAEKGPMFSDVGGSVAIYDVVTWNPFSYQTSAGGGPFDRPTIRIKTSAPNPVGLTVYQNAALVLCAPFSGDAVLDVIDLGASPPQISSSIRLGHVYKAGVSVPVDPRVSPDGSQALIGTEIGLLRVALSSETVIQ
jgi:hypothetical protein